MLCYRNLKQNYNNESKEETKTRPHTRSESIKVYNEILKSGKLKQNKDTKSHEQEFEKISFKKLDNKNLNDLNMIKDVLKSHFFMRNLSEENMKEVIKEMFLSEIKANSVVLMKGTVGVFLYIVKEGLLEVEVDGNCINILKSGDSFGELALLHNSTRTSTVISKTDCLCWCLDRRKFRKVIDHINSNNFTESKHFIKSMPILANIPNDMISILCSNILKIYYENNEYIIRKGDTSQCMYIIKEGEVDIYKDNQHIRTLGKNDYFGDQGLLLNQLRTMNVISKGKCVIYCITKELMIRMLGQNYLEILILSLIKHCFNKSKYFSTFNLSLLDQIFNYFEIKKYNHKEVVIPKGESINSKVIVLLEGDLVDSTTKEVLARRGEIVFEDYLIKYSSKNCIVKAVNDIIAQPDCLMVETNTNTFLNRLGIENFSEILSRFTSMNLLLKIPYFSRLSYESRNEVINLFKTEKIPKGMEIIKQGQSDPFFYIIKNGSIQVKKNTDIVNDDKFNCYFNDSSLFKDLRSDYSIFSQTNLEILKVESSKLVKYFSDPLLKYYRETYLYRSCIPSIKDLIFIRDLGASSIGTISLVKCKFSHLYFASKSISKIRIVEEKLLDILYNESQISKQLEHPFITKAIKALQSKHHVIFIKEYINGSELFVAMNEIGLFNKAISQFFFSSILFAIDYLHKQNIIYRDVKPENVIIADNVSYVYL